MASSAGCPIRAPQNPEWFAVRTWSRHEKTVVEQLRRKQIDTFFPLYHSPKRWKNGQIGAQLPLFPGYLFVRINIQDRLPVLQTSGVARFVGFGHKPTALPESEITKLEAAMKKGIMVYPHPYLAVGDRVRIGRGPLMGLTGVLTRHKQELRVVLSVELIAKSISVELDSADVEPF